mgnify:CR=1 FL=1
MSVPQAVSAFLDIVATDFKQAKVSLLSPYPRFVEMVEERHAAAALVLGAAVLRLEPVRPDRADGGGCLECAAPEQAELRERS